MSNQLPNQSLTLLQPHPPNLLRMRSQIQHFPPIWPSLNQSVVGGWFGGEFGRCRRVVDFWGAEFAGMPEAVLGERETLASFSTRLVFFWVGFEVLKGGGLRG